MMAIGIPEYRLPRVELERDISAIRGLGVEIRLNTAMGRDITLQETQAEYDAVLLAVGAQRSQRLGIPGEDLDGVYPATSFLKRYNLDADTTLSGSVVVIGGGSTAMDAARSALRAGATEAHICYRRTQADMPAQAEEVVAALEEGIQLHPLTTPVSLVGDGGSVVGIRLQRMAQGEPDAQGRRSVTAIEGSEFELSIDYVLVAIGEAPDPSFLPQGTSVEVAAWGGLLINPQTLATGAPGVFAAGDITYGPKTVIHAAAHGRQAAKNIHAYLRGLSPRDVSELPDDEPETVSRLPEGGQITLDLRSTPRAVMPLRERSEARSKQQEFALGFEERQARLEASRCLRCDLAYLCPSVRVIGAPASATSDGAAVPAIEVGAARMAGTRE
ncbi:MAG TPA: FAD-dependent oxidoreductase, partial [Ktedonobacterales bacterium]|nr:FAD-dependent oxidoreductase [Ktedonobacterales bacterium]